MSSIQETLDSLKPYVVSIRTVGELSVVDAVFEDGWTIPESELVQYGQDENQPNYFMFFSEEEGVGFDEILEYVESIIKLNLEMKMKYELLRKKVKELQEVFKANSLSKLKTLKFTFSTPTNFSGDSDEVDELISSTIPEEEAKVEIEEKPIEEKAKQEKKPSKPTKKPEEKVESKEVDNTPKKKVDDNVPVHEANNGQKVELPPKKVNLPEEDPDLTKKIELEDHSLPEHLMNGECNCGPDKACPKCIDQKEYI